MKKEIRRTWSCSGKECSDVGVCVCVWARTQINIFVYIQFVLKQEKPSTKPQPVKSPEKKQYFDYRPNTLAKLTITLKKPAKKIMGFENDFCFQAYQLPKGWMKFPFTLLQTYSSLYFVSFLS